MSSLFNTLKQLAVTAGVQGKPCFILHPLLYFLVKNRGTFFSFYFFVCASQKLNKFSALKVSYYQRTCFGLFKYSLLASRFPLFFFFKHDSFTRKYVKLKDELFKDICLHSHANIV